MPSYADLETAEKSAATLGAGEVSNSWGAPRAGETPELEGASPFNHKGIVITAAAGDDGYLDWDAEEASERGYVGLSRVLSARGRGGRHPPQPLGTGSAWAGETVWNGDGAGGGGCSVCSPRSPGSRASPTGRGSAAETNAPSPMSPRTRTPTPASPSTTPSPECEYRYEEAKVKHVLYWCTIGGTSVASPLIASTFALAGGANGVEYPAKTLYENEVKSPDRCTTSTTGSNGECHEAFTETGLSGCTTPESQPAALQAAICRAGDRLRRPHRSRDARRDRGVPTAGVRQGSRIQHERRPELERNRRGQRTRATSRRPFRLAPRPACQPLARSSHRARARSSRSCRRPR